MKPPCSVLLLLLWLALAHTSPAQKLRKRQSNLQLPATDRIRQRFAEEVFILDTLRLATEYEPAGSPTTPVWQTLYRPDSASVGSQRLYHPARRFGRRPAPVSAEDREASDLERVLNRKKQSN
jgi:hypothetical protein